MTNISMRIKLKNYRKYYIIHFIFIFLIIRFINIFYILYLFLFLLHIIIILCKYNLWSINVPNQLLLHEINKYYYLLLLTAICNNRHYLNKFIMNNVNWHCYLFHYSLTKKYRNLERDARNSINLKLKKLIKYYQI